MMITNHEPAGRTLTRILVLLLLVIGIAGAGLVVLSNIFAASPTVAAVFILFVVGFSVYHNVIVSRAHREYAAHLRDVTTTYTSLLQPQQTPIQQTILPSNGGDGWEVLNRGNQMFRTSLLDRRAQSIAAALIQDNLEPTEQNIKLKGADFGVNGNAMAQTIYARWVAWGWANETVQGRPGTWRLEIAPPGPREG